MFVVEMQERGKPLEPGCDTHTHTHTHTQETRVLDGAKETQDDPPKKRSQDQMERITSKRQQSLIRTTLHDRTCLDGCKYLPTNCDQDMLCKNHSHRNGTSHKGCSLLLLPLWSICIWSFADHRNPNGNRRTKACTHPAGRIAPDRFPSKSSPSNHHCPNPRIEDEQGDSH